MENVNNSNRRVKLKSHFGETPPTEGLYFKGNSNWEPPNPHHTVKTFTESFKNNMKKILETNQKNMNKNENKKNLNKKEREVLEALKNRTDIIITNADKGGALVINDVKAYLSEANRQLSNKDHYKKLNYNPTSENGALVENAIDSLRLDGSLDEKWQSS